MFVVLLSAVDWFCCPPENMLLNCENIPPKFIGNEELDAVVVEDVELVEEETVEVEFDGNCPPLNMF